MAESRSVFIRGAAAGIGQEAARLFHSRGYGVGLYDVDAQGVARLAGELGERTLASPLDVTDAEAFSTCANRFQEHFGRFDALLNNAGILRQGRFDEVPLAIHKRTLEVNFGGVIHGVAAALPHLKATAAAHGESRIINMASASAIYGTPDHSTYSATKCAVRGLTEALQLELEADGVWVCDVLPFFVDTGMVRDQENKSSLVDSFGVDHTPQEVAELIWSASQKRQVHWFGGPSLRWSDRLARLFPGLTRQTFRKNLAGR